MDLYNRKAFSVALALVVVVIGLTIAWWGYSNFIGSDQVHCKVTHMSGASCGTKFGFVLVVVFVLEAFGLNYIRSKYLGYG